MGRRYGCMLGERWRRALGWGTGLALGLSASAGCSDQSGGGSGTESLGDETSSPADMGGDLDAGDDMSDDAGDAEDGDDAGGDMGTDVPVDDPNCEPLVGDADPSSGELAWTFQEEVPGEVEVAVDWCAGRPAEDRRIWLVDRPLGSAWNEAERRFRFRPDFIQGGHVYGSTLVIDDGVRRVEIPVAIDVPDTIHPADPVIVQEEQRTGYRRLVLEQTTDDFLDSTGYAGRTFQAVLAIPDGAGDDPNTTLPVRVQLHGFGTSSPNVVGWYKEIRIAPHDPNNTYWWGYGDQLPDSGTSPSAQDDVPDYTARRVLHLLDWVEREVPGADPSRTYLAGSSMGGAGSMTIGIEHARHFAWIRAELGQSVPMLHRSARINQLETHWGPAGDNEAWTRMDLTHRILEGDADDVLLFSRHGTADTTIAFSAAVEPSPLTEVSFYDALQLRGVGHYVVWDGGTHGPPDPTLGDDWWDEGFSAIHDSEVAVRADAPFLAFSAASHDGVAPTVDGGVVLAGDPAGCFNRHLRWRTDDIEDSVDGFSAWVQAREGEGDPPSGDYPSTGDWLPDDFVAAVDIRPARLRAFSALAGETIYWRFGELSGQVEADEDGRVTVPNLPVTAEWVQLELARSPL